MATETRTGRRYAGLLDHERRAERRARLLNVGLELFGTIGFQKTTIPMLCRAANVTARHFYDAFESREALFKELYDEIAHRSLELVAEALKDSESTAHEKIRKSNEAYVEYMTSDPRRARVYALESMGVSAEMEQHRRSIREAFVKLITPRQSAVMAPLDNRLLSVAVAAAAQGLLLEWTLAVEKPPIGKMVDTLAIIWIRTLKLEELGENARALGSVRAS